SVLLVVDRHLKILTANAKYYVTFPNILERAEGAFLPDALPRAFLYKHEIIRKIQEVAQTSIPVRLPEAFYVSEQDVQHFLDVYICPVTAAPGDREQPCNILLVIDDVTEMKRLENEIRDRERYFRNLVNNSIVAIMAADGDANFTLFNEGAEKLLGTSSAEMHNTPASQIFFHEPDFREVLEGIRSEEKVEDYETEFVNRSGERIQVSLFATSLRNENSELIGYLIVGVDIRERKRAERNLIRRNKELSTLYSVGHTLSSSSPIEGRLRRVADQIAAAFACHICAVAVCRDDDSSSVEKVYVSGAHHLPAEGTVNKISEILTRRVMRRQKPVFGESLLDDAELSRNVTDPHVNASFTSVPLTSTAKIIGSLAIIKLEAPPLESEDTELLSSLGQRIAMSIENDRLYAEQERNVSQLRALLKATRAIGSILDPDTVLEALTTQAMRIAPCRSAVVLSYSSEENTLSVVACKSSTRTRGLKKGSSFSATESAVKQLLKSLQPCCCSARDEKRCPVKQGLLDAGINFCLCLPITFDDSFYVLTLGQDDHRPFSDRAIHIVSDLMVHASLSIKNARLYTALQAAYADLKTAQDAMVKAEKYRAIGELSAGVAHDFNNALSIILGRAQFLMSLTEDKPVLKGLKSIENASRDAANIVKRMQEFSKAVTQKPYSRIDVNEMVRQVLDIVEPRWRKLAEVEGLLLKVVHRLQKVQPISGDAGELREALTNILFNAIDAMPTGGKLSIRTGVRGDSVFVEVKDTGVGMPPEVQKKVFQPFFTTKSDGMGLGLSLVYGTVKRHNGDIQLETQPNEGTSVTLLFPTDLSVSEVRESSEPAPIVRKAIVLIVDDNREVTSTLRQMLESASHEVTAVTDGQKGISKYQESKFDIVITDIGMPGLSGWDVSKAIKAYDPDARIILITAWGAQLDQARIKECGASIVIHKPFEKNKILSAIKDLLPDASPGQSPTLPNAK
ncbi:response regulator, partial [bacterium]|nr:response regulator [bacterium]